MSCSAQNFFYNTELFQPNWEAPHFRSTRVLAESTKALAEFLEFTHFIYTHKSPLHLSCHITLHCEWRCITWSLSAFSSPLDTLQIGIQQGQASRLHHNPRHAHAAACAEGQRWSQWCKYQNGFAVPLIFASFMWPNKPWFHYLFLCNNLPKT